MNYFRRGLCDPLENEQERCWGMAMQRLFQNLESEDEYIGAYRGNTRGLPGLQL